MFEKFLSENSADFRQRYEGTFGFYRDETGKRTLSYLSRVRDHTCIFTDAKGVEYSLNANTDKDIGFEFVPPKAGFFNTTNGAVLVQRQAQRQFQRGVTNRNITAHLVNNKGGFLAQDIDFSLMVMLYEQARSAKEALPYFRKEGAPTVPSWAVTPQFCLDTGGNVWVYQESIGKWTGKDKFVVSLHDKTLYKTELTDAFKAVGHQVEFN